MTEPRTILIAEDDDTDVWFFRRACERAQLNHRLCFVKDGEQALDYLQGKPPYTDAKHFPPPDLLIVDLKMPGLDGFGVLKFVHNTPSLSQLPVIVLSSSVLGQDKLLAEALGASAFYSKTPDSLQMQQMLREIFGKYLHDGSDGEPEQDSGDAR
jgi:CheY-like chemotaxis protein